MKYGYLARHSPVPHGQVKLCRSNVGHGKPKRPTASKHAAERNSACVVCVLAIAENVVAVLGNRRPAVPEMLTPRTWRDSDELPALPVNMEPKKGPKKEAPLNILMLAGPMLISRSLFIHCVCVYHIYICIMYVLLHVSMSSSVVPLVPCMYPFLGWTLTPDPRRYG